MLETDDVIALVHTTFVKEAKNRQGNLSVYEFSYNKGEKFILQKSWLVANSQSTYNNC